MTSSSFFNELSLPSFPASLCCLHFPRNSHHSHTQAIHLFFIQVSLSPHTRTHNAMSSTTPPLKPDQCDPVPGTPSSPAGRGKLQKIPPIPIRRSKVSSSSTTTHAGNVDEGQEEDSSSILLASSLGLNHIRTRSSSFPLRYSSSLGAPSFLTQDAVTVNDARLRSKSNNSHPRKVLGPHSSLLIRFSNVKTKTQLFLYLASVLFSFPNEMVSDYFVLALLGGKVHLGKSKTLRPHSQLIPGLEVRT